MPRIIPIDEIPPQYAPQSEIALVATVLINQGQIEPVVLDAAMNLGKYNWWDPAVVEAARSLGWPTILVTWPGER